MMSLAKSLGAKYPSLGASRNRRAVGDAYGGLALSFGGVNLTGVPVTERNLLTLASAWACVNVIATDVGCLPLKVFRARKGGGADEVRDHAVSELVAGTPDGETPARRQREAWIEQALVFGTGYLEAEFDADGAATGLYLVNPVAIEPARRAGDNGLYYRLSTGGTIPAYRILTLCGRSLDGLHGYKLTRLHAQTLGLGLAIQQYKAAFYGNACTPKVAFTHPMALSEEAERRLIADLEGQHRGTANAHRILLLQEGMGVEALSITPKDGELDASQAAQVIEVCRIWRVPPTKVMDYSRATFGNVEETNIDYVINVVTPWCVREEDILNLKLFTRAERAAGFYVKHNVDALLRGNMLARAESHSKLIGCGVRTVNKARALEDDNPVDGGDEAFYPLNMTTVKNVGKQLPAPASAKGSVSRNGKTEFCGHVAAR